MIIFIDRKFSYSYSDTLFSGQGRRQFRLIHNKNNVVKIRKEVFMVCPGFEVMVILYLVRRFSIYKNNRDC